MFSFKFKTYIWPSKYHLKKEKLFKIPNFCHFWGNIHNLGAPRPYKKIKFLKKNCYKTFLIVLAPHMTKRIKIY